MQYIVLLTGFFVFLFTLFAMARDDFVLFRRNVDMEKVFNVAFLALGIGLFSSRLFFVIFNFKPVYLNPLAFLLFPYFPGLSLPGGILGLGLGLIFILSGKKYPEGRIFDFFMLSGTVAMIVGEILQLGLFYIGMKHISLPLIFEICTGLLIFLLCLRVFKHQGMKEGSIGLVLVIFSSLIFIGGSALAIPADRWIFYKDCLAWSIVFVVSLVFYIKQESPVSFLKLLGKK